MVTAILLLSGSLVLGQSPPGGGTALESQYFAGLELVYRGTCTEEALAPSVQYQRHYAVEAFCLIYEVNAKQYEVALMTSITPQSEKGENRPASVRLELAGVDRLGRVKFSPDAQVQIPLAGPPTIETGFLFEVPSHRLNINDFWEVGEHGRPPRTWMIVGQEMKNGITCLKLVGQQQSDDWDLPRADRTGWKRRDILWFSPQMGLVTRVERTIERREPARRDPTERVVVTYDLESRLKYPGKMFEDRKHDIDQFRKIQAEASPLFRNPAQYRGQIDSLMKRVALNLESPSRTPYRKALVQLQTKLDASRTADLPPDSPQIEAVSLKSPVAIGQRVPDFVVSSLTSEQSTRLYRLLGRPTLVIYYNPATPTGREVLAFAQKLMEKHEGNLTVLAMAVTQDVEIARKQHAQMKLPFAIHDGSGLHLTFGVDATPRIVLLDGDALVRLAFTGWGIHSAREVTEEFLRALPK